MVPKVMPSTHACHDSIHAPVHGCPRSWVPATTILLATMGWHSQVSMTLDFLTLQTLTMRIRGTCIDQNALIYSTAGITIAFDVLVIILPLPRLIALEIPTRKKIAVLVTFALGGFVTICSIIRLRTLVVWGSATNVTWYYNPIAIWSNVELNLGVLCACIPATAGLLQRIYSKVTGKKFSTYGQRSGLGTNREKEQERDRNYEMRLQSTDGSPKYQGRDFKGAPTTVGVRAMYSEMDASETRSARSSISRDDDMTVVGERALPSIMESEPRMSTSPHEAVDQMIHNGYTQYAKMKR